MKKLLLVFGIVAVIVAGVVAVVLHRSAPAGARATPADCDYVSHMIGGQPLVAVGTSGDFLVRVPATDELNAIAAKAKTTKFMSIDNPAQYAQDGFVLINIVPISDQDDRGCPYRLTAGMADINRGGKYAVELCHN